MMSTINSFVSKVMKSVQGPLYSWGSKKGVKSKKVKCNHKRNCKC